MPEFPSTKNKGKESPLIYMKNGTQFVITFLRLSQDFDGYKK